MPSQKSTQSPPSRKRSYDEVEGTAEEETPTTSMSRAPSRQPSPSVTLESSALSETKSIQLNDTRSQTSAAAPANTPAKKRKLTFAEKEVEKVLKASEKEARERAKAEEVQKKEKQRLEKLEEKRRREEEKETSQRAKEMEKAQKQKVKEAKEAEKKAKDAERKAARDAEKQAKDQAHRLKEEAKEKKERSQLKLGAFFQKTSGSADPSRSPSRKSSVVSLGMDGVDNEGLAKCSPQKKADAKQAFLPFFVQSHVEMAPVSRYWSDPNISHMASARMDMWLKKDNRELETSIQAAFPHQRRDRSQKSRRTMKELIERVRGSSSKPIDLTEEAGQDTISEVPYKVLFFGEDVRPPYTGTYTRSVPAQSAIKLSRCPTARLLPDTNYEYDSEAEWEPPNEDDEDLDSGDDLSDGGDEGDEDMDGFLDDEDDTSKRKLIVADLKPISSGLCWESSLAEKGPLEEYRMQPVSNRMSFPIDPFATIYWATSVQQASRQASSATTTMHPPRVPLSNLNPNTSPGSTPSGQTALVKGNEKSQGTIAQIIHAPAQKATLTNLPSKPVKMAPPDVIQAFRTAVDGSDLTKAGLVEVLKKQFPKLSKDTIRDTLAAVAVRQGAKEAEKRWVLK